MVSLRCKMIVKKELVDLGFHPVKIDWGVVEIQGSITDTDREKVRESLSQYGLELLNDRESILVEQIKGVVIDLIYYAEEAPKMNYSDCISEKLNYDYTYLSNIFSKVKGITIQQFIIMSKIERVKELMMYGEMNLTEISYKLNYSSVAHLSNQFKKITGFSPSYFMQSNHSRIGLESI